MATQQSNISAALLRLVAAINTVSGRSGTLSSLTTTDKTSIVNALNEVKASIPSAASFIDDTAAQTGKTWSSTKIQAQVTAAIAALINGSDAQNDTLKELADRITAIAQAEVGLISFAQTQTLTAAQQLQAGNNLGVGDPAFDYVPGIVTALNAGL